MHTAKILLDRQTLHSTLLVQIPDGLRLTADHLTHRLLSGLLFIMV